MILVGMIAQLISLAANSVVLGILLWKTCYIFRMDKDARGATKLTKTLAYNGTVKDVFLRVRLSLIDSVMIGSAQFGYILFFSILPLLTGIYL